MNNLDYVSLLISMYNNLINNSETKHNIRPTNFTRKIFTKKDSKSILVSLDSDGNLLSMSLFKDIMGDNKSLAILLPTTYKTAIKTSDNSATLMYDEFRYVFGAKGDKLDKKHKNYLILLNEFINVCSNSTNDNDILIKGGKYAKAILTYISKNTFEEDIICNIDDKQIYNKDNSLKYYTDKELSKSYIIFTVDNILFGEDDDLILAWQTFVNDYLYKGNISKKMFCSYYGIEEKNINKYNFNEYKNSYLSYYMQYDYIDNDIAYCSIKDHISASCLIDGINPYKIFCTSDKYSYYRCCDKNETVTNYGNHYINNVDIINDIQPLDKDGKLINIKQLVSRGSIKNINQINLSNLNVDKVYAMIDYLNEHNKISNNYYSSKNANLPCLYIFSPSFKQNNIIFGMMIKSDIYDFDKIRNDLKSYINGHNISLDDINNTYDDLYMLEITKSDNRSNVKMEILDKSYVYNNIINWHENTRWWKLTKNIDNNSDSDSNSNIDSDSNIDSNIDRDSDSNDVSQKLKYKLQLFTVTISDIIKCAYFTENDYNNKKYNIFDNVLTSNEYLRLYRNVLYGNPISNQIMLIKKLCFNTINRCKYSDTNVWEKIKRVTLACLNNYYKCKGEDIMLLDVKKTDRSYLFGRLCAVAHMCECSAIKNRNRKTNAELYMSNFYHKSPYIVFNAIEKAINYCKDNYTEICIREIRTLFNNEDEYTSNKPVDLGLFIIGYDTQINYMYTSKKDRNTVAKDGIIMNIDTKSSNDDNNK